ncbi:helix-turn-helix domain-containing protein [Candidatus Kaiserbacteria bacterium]|nr:helix-turn-helix domain-containing protein [Candidatus Kaiserbacteria bacterium]
MPKNKAVLPDKRFFSVAELAHTLGVSRVAVFRKIRSGAIHAEKVGRAYVIPREEFAAALGDQ